MHASKPTIAVLITCHNRRHATVRAIQALRVASTIGVIRIFLVDDGSTDGTADAVRATDNRVKIIVGSGSLYWNGGMRLAWEHALDATPDFYLWLNDDLTLDPGSIDGLVSDYYELAEDRAGRVIVVGRTLSPETDDVTYGGLKSAGGLSRLRWRHLKRSERVCDTFNGNCVLIPAVAVAEVGINSAKYRHALGDLDYGLRAARAGYNIVESSMPVGRQRQNLAVYSGTHLALNLENVRRVFFDPKGIPIGEWWTFCRQYGGVLWLINFANRYVRTFLGGHNSVASLQR